MSTNIAKQTILSAGFKGLLISFITITISCDDEPFASQLITFIIPASIEPADSIVTVGDTLWIMVNASDSLYDYHTNKKYKVPNFNFGQTSVVFRELVNNKLNLGEQLSAAQHFNFIDFDNQIAFPGETFVDIKFKYNKTSERYELHIGIIPKKVGIYCLRFLGPTELVYNGIIELGRSPEGATIFPIFGNIYFPINDGKNNYNMFKSSCLATYSGLQEDYAGYYGEFKGTFTFKVVK
jgi:hypothetical protein